MDMQLPRALPPAPLATIKDSEITNRRKVVLSATAPEADAAGHWQEFEFFVDGKKFDPGRIDQRVKLGAVEEWTIVNTHEHDDHVFHIHTNPFQVISANEGAGGAGMAGFRDRGAQGRGRVPLALYRFHRCLHAPLPHDEPRGDGHDADGRGL
ncbi:FtsP/CotA-like multicopper oxidase with cupredoxin domain [Bradyrhizobium sp. GM22.5]